MKPEERIEKIKNDIRSLGDGPCPSHPRTNFDQKCDNCLADLEKEIVCCELDQLKAELKAPAGREGE